MRLAALLILALALGAADARAATVSVGASVDRRCQDGLHIGQPGIATAGYTAPSAGLVTIRLDGDGGDWDLAAYSAAPGATNIASATTSDDEHVVAWLPAGASLTAQACRVRGGAADADLTFAFDGYDPAARSVQLVHVPLGGADDLARLEATGLDVTHAAGPTGADVLLVGDEDARALRRAGFTATAVDTPDPPARRATRALPSTRTTYRTPADYSTDLKELVADHPGLVRALDLGRSVEDRPIEGIEISENVERTDDGRPVLALFGLHHAREWPSGEMPLEFALDVVARYAAGEDAIEDLLRRVRIVVVPVVNPDGFQVSRSFADDPSASLPPSAGVADIAEYRRRNCRATTASTAPCAGRPTTGVDLNRNYGAYWGGTGSSGSTTSDLYRGPAPFSEPESQAIHRFSQQRAPVTVISHHTYTNEGVWLRQPGFCFTAPCGGDDITPDEAGMAALGQAMATATGWESSLGWALNGGSEITGATEDWNYFATGAYGYTPEQRGEDFHPAYAGAVVAEYDGSAAGAQGGMYAALLAAAQQAADDAQHSVLTGTAPAGTQLRLTKAFATPTSQPAVTVADEVDLALTVGPSGSFTWDVNPSTRPLAGGQEAYTLTCGGQATRQVVVARGQRLDLGRACEPVVAPPHPPGPDPVVPAPPSTPTPPAVTPPSSPPAAPGRTLSIAARQQRSTVLSRGVLVSATCATSCTLATQVRKPSGTRGTTVLGKRTLKLRAGRRVQFRLKLSKAGRRAVTRYRHQRLTVRVGTVSRSVQLVGR